MITNKAISPTFKFHHANSKMAEFVMPLVAFNDNKILALGTCVPIAGNLAMAAWHVMDHFCKEFDQSQKVAEYKIAKNFSIWAIQIINQGTAYGIWSVDYCPAQRWTDVAFLKLNPYNIEASDYKRLPCAKLNLIPPPIGSRVTGFGYCALTADMTTGTDGTRHFDINGKLAETTGKVIEIHEPYRDTFLLGFPCYRTNAKFEGGMSGGPIFNDDSELCGLICLSHDKSDSEIEEISYITTLWPSMATLIRANRDGKYDNTPHPILDLVKSGLIQAKNWENINLYNDTQPKVSIKKYLPKDTLDKDNI